jgi:DNA-binding CsgD family transcriptional regulator
MLINDRMELRIKMLEVNDWILINAITYKIQAIEDLNEMQLAVMKQLKFLIDFDSASFYTVLSKGTAEIGNPVGINYSLSDMNKYLQVFKEVDYSKGLMSTGKNITYRESDIMNDELRVQTEYYKKVYDAQNWHYSLHLNISHNEVFLGVMSFFRVKGKENFDYTSTFIIDMIKDHLALRLFKEIYNTKHNELLSLTECTTKFKLTAREQNIVSLILDGMQDSEICENLFITSNTFKKHILNIYRKIGINKRIQLLKLVQND